MTTKEYLSQIRRYDKNVNNKLSELFQLRQLSVSISVSVKEDNIQSSSDKDKLGSVMAKIIDLENEINSIVDDFLTMKTQIVMQISSIDDDMRYQVLFSRYVEGKKFERIAEEQEYSERQIMRIHLDALDDFEEKFGEKYLEI